MLEDKKHFQTASNPIDRPQIRIPDDIHSAKPSSAEILAIPPGKSLTDCMSGVWPATTRHRPEVAEISNLVLAHVYIVTCSISLNKP